MTTPAFPPYSGEDVTCPKCHNQGASTTYRAYGRCSHPSDLILGWEPNERLCRRCRNCGYGWDEATTGNIPPAEDTPTRLRRRPVEVYALQWTGDNLIPMKNFTLQRMADRLAGLPYATKAAADTAAVIEHLKTARAHAEKLADVWHAVELWTSGDWGEDQVKDALTTYEGGAGEVS